MAAEKIKSVARDVHRRAFLFKIVCEFGGWTDKKLELQREAVSSAPPG
jgi:hypothetical protein